MEKFVITGGKPLHGEVTISGAKNAAVGILPATILAADVCVIENLPDISDVAVSLKVNNLYGELQFLVQPVYELRNESISLTTPDFKRAHKSVKIVLSTFVGNVEVVRK